jgi:hypothetical protein
LIIGSKRAKNSVEETSGSKSYIKQESSFKNWISSMVKGISQSIQHDSNSLSLRIANPGHLNAWSDEKLIAHKTNQDPEPKKYRIQIHFSVHVLSKFEECRNKNISS